MRKQHIFTWPRHLALLSLALILSGCSVFDSYNEVRALNEVQAVGGPFTQQLAHEYKNFSTEELREMYDYPDALHFARKGLAAASGQIVLPENLSDWNLNEDGIRELSTARGRLILAFDLGAREIAPELAGRAQARFDCWVEQQEEDDHSQDIEACKKSFMQIMSTMEPLLIAPEPVADPFVYVEQAVIAEPIAPQPAPPPLAPENAIYLVFFDWDQFKLDEGAGSVTAAVATEVANNTPKQINITGHADTSGSKNYNKKLAFKRATAVRNGLIERGVNAELIKIESRGENELLVPTADNVREPANRRATINFK